MSRQNLDKAFCASGFIVKHFERSPASDRRKELDLWLEESKENHLLFAELTDREQLQLHLLEFERIDAGKKAALRKVRGKIFRGKRNVSGMYYR